MIPRRALRRALCRPSPSPDQQHAGHDARHQAAGLQFDGGFATDVAARPPASPGIVPVAVFTLVYTKFGGQLSSFMTAVFQAVPGGALHLRLRGRRRQRRPVVQGVCVERPRLRDVWSPCFAVARAEVFNLAFWLRVYFARDAKQLRTGFAVGWLWSLS